MLKAVFFIAGFVLFIGQLSGKFYLSSSLPIHASIGHYAQRHHQCGCNHSDQGHTQLTRLSLDKRYYLTTVFGVPAPVINATHFTALIPQPLPLWAGDPLSGLPVHSHLRGPPASID